MGGRIDYFLVSAKLKKYVEDYFGQSNIMNTREIEKKWQKKWAEAKIYEPNLDKAEKPFYNLMMFPYPSAEGLHVGNMYAFAHSDVYGRFKRLQGYDVFEPIGLDGFGIHSENYAIKIGEHIRDVSRRTEANFYKQLKMIGNQYDLSRKVETYKPEYYKWTQWLFLKMYEKGLAYRKASLVNWCANCKTVLSDEQIVGGECERCDTKTEKKEMKQWFFKITDYADKLLDNLEKLDWSIDVKTIQKNWIGKSVGAEIKFLINNSQASIKVFTTRPDTVFGATFLVICPEHHFIHHKLKDIVIDEKFKNVKGAKNWNEIKKYIKEAKNKSDLDRTDLNKNKTGIKIKGIKAINPATNEKIPIFIADYVLPNYGTGAIMSVPAHDERDFEFAKKYGLEIKEVVAQKIENKENKLEKAFTSEGFNINSDFLNGLSTKKSKEKVISWLEKKKIGKGSINYKLRDWCVSRQRYWGPPIPMAYCEQCDWQPIKEDDLPVVLPEMDDFLPDGTGKGPLNKVENFVNTKCPKCAGDARRETDVSDPFVDSCWYYLRYLSTELKYNALDKKRLARWMPVDMYVGGKEHSVLHLLYSRFINMVMHELGYSPEEEPFKKFRAHGLVVKDGAKMSKSKGNVINPDKYIKRYGADTVRMYLMFMGDMRQGGDWRDSGVAGIYKFLNKVFSLKERITTLDQLAKRSEYDSLNKLMHKTIKNVGEKLENLKFNTAISDIMVLVSKMNEIGCTTQELSKLSIILAPFAPHLAEDIWAFSKESNKDGKEDKFVFEQKWPKYDADIARDDLIDLVVQVNSKVRDKIEVTRDIQEQEARDVALASSKIEQWIEGKEIAKVVFVPGRLINLVVK